MSTPADWIRYPGPAMSDLSTPAPRWSPARLILFRFGLLYFVLYSLPFPFSNLWSFVSRVHTQLQFGEKTPTPNWIRKGFEWIGEFESGWQWLTTWLAESGWVGVEILHQRTGSGDTAHALVKLGVATIAALLLTLVWSLIDRWSTHYRRTGKWLHLGVRWYVAFTLLGYGLIKFYSGQFSYPSLQRLMTPMGDYSPMGLVWTFMGFSKPYEVLSGVGETLGGLLLFWRRTSLLGCFVAIPVMANVVALNWMFDVPVKLYSTNLLVFMVALTVPELPRLSALFFTNRATTPVDYRIVPWAWLRYILIAFGALWVGFHLYQSHTGYVSLMARRAITRPELYGVWEVEKMVRDGKVIERTDPERWKLLAIDVRDRAWVRTVADQTQWLHYKENLTDKNVGIAPLRGATPPKETYTLTFERGDTTQKGPHPAPRTMADFGKTVDVTRPSLVLRGPWQGGEIELHLLRKRFRLERGFHLVQEIPFNR